MKARTIGPILLMLLGATLMIAPATGWVGALTQVPCDTSAVPGAVQPCNPCPTNIAIGVAVVCDTTVPPTVVDTAAPTTTTAVGSGGSSLPGTGGTSAWYVLLGGTLVLAGGALLVVGRRTHAPQA